MNVLTTSRLLLRPWRDADREPFAQLNADPLVMEHYPTTLSRSESDARVDEIVEHFAQHGWGLWAVELRATRQFMGFVGLWPRPYVTGDPMVEIGWRLARAHWGRGYATEAARAVLRFGFERLALDEIVSFTVPQNERSRRVMERIGLYLDHGRDFDHPRVDPERYPHLVRHVLYAITRADWEAQASPSWPNAAP